MRRLIAGVVLASFLSLSWAPAASAGSSTDIALGLAAFAVFNQVVAPLLRPYPAGAVYHRQHAVYTTVVTSPAVAYPAPPVVYPAPVVYGAPPTVPSPPQPTVVYYPHGRYELQIRGGQYVWVWIPSSPPPPPPPPPPAALPAP